MLALSSMIVCLMCPAMSLIATLLFKKPGIEVVSVLLQTFVLNFSMAFFSQIFFIGPFVRTVFGLIFKIRTNKTQKAERDKTIPFGFSLTIFC